MPHTTTKEVIDYLISKVPAEDREDARYTLNVLNYGQHSDAALAQLKFMSYFGDALVQIAAESRAAVPEEVVNNAVAALTPQIGAIAVQVETIATSNQNIRSEMHANSEFLKLELATQKKRLTRMFYIVLCTGILIGFALRGFLH